MSKIKKQICLMILLCIVINGFQVIKGQQNQELIKLKEEKAKRSTHYEKFLAKEVSNIITPSEYHAQIAIPLSQGADFERFARIVVRDYEKQKSQADLGMKILSFNNDLVKKAVATRIGASVVTGGTSLALTVVGVVASKSLDELLEVAKRESRNAYRINLRTSLETFRGQATAAEKNELNRTTDPQRFKQILENRVGPILSNALAGIPSEEQDIVNNNNNKLLAETLRDGLGSLNNTQVLQGAKIEENRRNIVGFGRLFIKFAEKNQQQLKEIRDTQNEITEGVNNLSKEVAETKQGVEFLQQYTFGKMSASEQLGALQSGQFPNIQGGERTKLLRLVEKRKLLNDEIPAYLNGAQQVLGIAQTLGISGPFIAKAQQAVNVSSAALNAFTAFSSGNLLGGISAVASIFGLGGRDIATERHQEIMNTLGAMYERLGVMDQKLDVLLSGQEEIKKAQQVTFNALIKISDQIQHNHEEVMSMLRSIQGEVIYNRQLIEVV